MSKEKKIVGTVTLDEAIEQFANMSEENKRIVEKAKQSKELEALDKIYTSHLCDAKHISKENLDRYVLVEKSLKALELIKKKRVNVRVFLKYCNREDGLKLYNNQCCDCQEMESKELAQEEYELLKEVLKWNH